MFPDADPAFLRTLLQTQPPPALENAVKQLSASPQYPKRRDSPMNGAYPEQQISASAQRQATPSAQSGPGGGGGLFSKLRKQFAGDTRPNSSQPQPAPTPPSLSRDSSSIQERPSGMTPSGGKPGSTPTPTAAVRANLTRAIQVSLLLLCSLRTYHRRLTVNIVSRLLDRRRQRASTIPLRRPKSKNPTAIATRALQRHSRS
jgi:hypothetical protein